MNLAACRSLPRIPENAVWYRAVLNRFFPTAFSHAHTRLAPSRFNAGSLLASADQFSTFYLAEDPVTALFEVGAVLGSLSPGGYLPHPLLAHTMLAVRVILQNIVDLTDAITAQALLDTTVQELTGDWQGYITRGPRTSVHFPVGIAPTQDLGREIYMTAGVEGFRAISAKLPFNQTLIVFPDKMLPGSSLTYRDSVTGAVVYQIRP